jgi:subtilisin-like proprotein convertase family protein
MLRYFLSLLCTLVGFGVLNAQSLWLDVPTSAAPSAGERRIVPEKFRAMRLDLNALQVVLATAPEAFTPSASTQSLPILEVPTPDGKISRFQIVETPVMAPELQAKYPEIRCYTGRGMDDHSAKIKLDCTPFGFHAMVTSANNGSYFIDPMVHGNASFYVVYFKKDYLPAKENAAWTCENIVPEGAEVLETGLSHAQTASPDFQGDTQLRRYRLALACTGEYAAFHGGTKPLVLAAMNTTMNRVNGVYETDFAVTMQIVANNDLLIYLTASSDPYTNNNGGTMLGQNITTCNSVIGSANYDVGHVFSTGGGGVAYLGVICGSNKGGGVTGSGSPVGDPFDIDYVAHEIGHQFGGPHTFNGTVGSCSGNASNADAMEPGSGSSIMAYAGICGANDLQPHSDAYFHANSLQRMTAHAITGSGNTCAVKVVSGNHNPDVNAGLDYTIPKSTPFALTAVGTDVDGDTLSYIWEQMDAAISTNPPVSSSATGPLFRSFTPNPDPIRVFPRLVDIVNNVNPVWEELPSVARTMNFRVVLRDNDWLAGCTDEDNAVVTVSAASGPFLVSAPNTNVLWNVGATQTVTWDVANTTAAPVSCANVRILLSTDGGFTYPVVLSANEPNDGTANITVPNNVSSTCRVKVEGLGNIFFDISNTNFRIEPPVVPTFFLSTNIGAATVCAGESTTFNVDLASALGFDTPADITITGAPVGATVTIGTNPVVPAGSTMVTLGDLLPAMAGVYTLNIQAVAGMVTRNAEVTITVLPGVPTTATLSSPANGVTGLSTVATLTWTANYATSSLVEVATNPSFAPGSIVSTQMVGASTASVAGLGSAAVYYWRVRTSNNCGEAVFSPVYAFQTGSASCGNDFSSSDVPKAIDLATVNTVVSTLNVPSNKAIADVNVSLAITHTYTGDLIARLVAPSNDTIDLFDQPGVPASAYGCAGANASLTFDSQASQTALLLEGLCNGTPPALSGAFQSIEPLSAMNGKNAQGTWKLLVTDNFAEDGGSLTAWSLSFCFPVSIPAGNVLANSPLSVSSGGIGNIATSNLQISTTGTTTQGQYIVLSLPQHGTLTLNGIALGIGGVFTQADINAGVVAYVNNGDQTIADNFHFDALDANNSGWSHEGVFNINVLTNNLSATAAQTQAVLCYNGTTGEITVVATGLDGTYAYRLNGGAAQSSNVFSNLAAGTYTVQVIGQFGFSVSTAPITIDNAPQIVVGATVTTDDLEVLASGGTGALTFSLNGVDFQTTPVFNDLANGIYTISVQDENGCIATTEVIVAVNSLLVSVLQQNGISCFDGNDGAIVVNIGGGQAPFAFSLNGGAPQSSNVFTGLTAGTYSVAVTDDLGFSATSTDIVLDSPLPVVASASAVLNTIVVTASGGTGVLTYSLNGGAFQSSNIFLGLSNGAYIVGVRDGNGCIVLTTVVVDIPPVVLTAAFTATLSCFGAADGVVTALAEGGIAPYTYALNIGSYQSSPVFTGLTADSYTLKVRDAVGTEVVVTFDITQPTPVSVVVTVVANAGTPTFSGGNAPYSYTTNAPNQDLQHLPNGTYTVSVTDANGCVDTTSFTINVPPLAWSAVVANVTCASAIDGSIIVTATGGIAPYEFSLNGGAFQSSNLFFGLGAGTYTVTTRDTEGNQTMGSIVVGSPAALVLTATVSGNGIVAVASGGTGAYQFSLNNGPQQASGSFTNLTPGSYTVIATDANGCAASVGNLMVTSAVVEPSEAWGLAVSPNPGTGLFQLTLQQAPITLRTEVFDAAGRLLRSTDFTPHGGTFSTLLDLRDLPNGTYILRLTDGQQWGGVRLSKVQ